MGCASSKKIGATSPTTNKAPDVYRPPPASFAVFDINSIEEPWLKLEAALQSQSQTNRNRKPSHVPAPLLEKVDAADDAAPPRTWEEISKALHDFKTQPPPPPPDAAVAHGKTTMSFHTVEELETQQKPAPAKPNGNPTRAESTRVEFGGESNGFRSVRENPFIVKDRIERAKEGKEATFERLAMMRRDPLGGFPDKCPPGGAGAVVLYTTSLRGVRKTFEDCNRARSVLEIHRVVFDERDVSLHAKFLSELRELLDDEAAVPRLFIHGRYIGGVNEVVELDESGRLARILSWAKVERGVGWQGCEGCGGARFVPCLDCGGSCKVVVGDAKERCSKCNENGLVTCPICH